MSFMDAVTVLLRTGDCQGWIFRWLGDEDSRTVDAVQGLREFLFKDI